MNRTRTNDDWIEARDGNTLRMSRAGYKVILGETSERRRTFLQTAGELLYGANWQVALAKDLVINDRTMRRWKRGESAIPEGIEARLITLCKDRAHKLLQLIGEAK